jgi:hypothetical protein
MGGLVCQVPRAILVLELILGIGHNNLKVIVSYLRENAAADSETGENPGKSK